MSQRAKSDGVPASKVPNRGAPIRTTNERTPWGSARPRRSPEQRRSGKDLLGGELPSEKEVTIVETVVRPAPRPQGRSGPRRSGGAPDGQRRSPRNKGGLGTTGSRGAFRAGAGERAVTGERAVIGERAGAVGAAPPERTGSYQGGTARSGAARSGAARRGAGPGENADEPRVAAKLADAARAYAADRYQDALRILRKLSTQAPTSDGVKELLGLTLYRLGRWPLALRELEAHRQLSGSYDQYPVIADCYRAMRRYAEADAIWLELRQASPSPDVLGEGRLVAAGCLADQGDLSGAIALLEAALRRSKPKSPNLRQWYALADLYERAGELARARDLFGRVAAVDPDAYDVRQRLVALA